jgi:hypothetical protein
LFLLLVVQSGCCKPPTSCGFTYINGTDWTKTPTNSMDLDCPHELHLIFFPDFPQPCCPPPRPEPAKPLCCPPAHRPPPPFFLTLPKMNSSRAPHCRSPAHRPSCPAWPVVLLRHLTLRCRSYRHLRQDSDAPPPFLKNFIAVLPNNAPYCL